MISLVIDVFLLTLLLLIAGMVIRTKRLYAVIVMSGAYSLSAAIIFVNLDAVDVAFTEAAVGAGISTVLFLAAMGFVPSMEKTNKNHNVLATLVCLVAGGLLMVAAFELPGFGDPESYVHKHVVSRYLLESGSALNIPNVVTTVLASYRGFDTLGETIVVFTAGLGVLMLLSGKTKTKYVPVKNKVDNGKIRKGRSDE